MANFSQLGISDFTMKSNIIGELSPILDVAVPRSQGWLLQHNEPIEMVLSTMETITPDATGAYTFELDHAMIDIPQMTDDRIIAVYDTVTESYLTIDSVDYEADEINVTDAVDGNECKVFYPFRDGIVQVAVTAPMGLGTVRLPLLNRGVANVHGVNQFLTTSPVKLREAPQSAGGNFGGWLLPETFRLQVLLKSTVPITTDTLARNYHISIPYRFTSWGQIAAVAPNARDAVLHQMVTAGGR